MQRNYLQHVSNIKNMFLDFIKFYFVEGLLYINDCRAMLRLYIPIISKDTVKCSLPDAFMAPKTVPTTEQQIPTNAIITMNHRIETV